MLLLAALSWWLRLGVERRVLVAALRGTVQLILVGLILKQLFAQSHPALMGLIALVMILVAG